MNDEVLVVPLKTRSESCSSFESQTSENGFFCWNSTRFLILALSVICFTLTLSNALVLNFTIICIEKDAKIAEAEIHLIHHIKGNSTFEDTKMLYVFSQFQQSWLISAVAIGNLIGAPILPYLSSKFGTRLIFTVYGLISAISTIFSPLAISFRFLPIFFMRIGQGIANSIGLPGIGAVTSHWAPISSSGIFISFLSSHMQFAPVFTMPLAGLFCESSIGWHGIFYLQGVLTLLAFLSFFAIYRDSPKFHKNVSSKELNQIVHEKPSSINQRSKGLRTPYIKILTDKSVIGVIITSLGAAIGFQVFNQYGPIYLNKVLNLDIKRTGFAAAIPYIFAMMVKIFAGPISDKFTFLSQKTRVIMFASISQYGMALCFILLACMPLESKLLAQLLYTFTIIFSGINCVGVLKGVTLQAMQYSYFLLTICAFIHNGVVLFFPFIISSFLSNNTSHEWSILFYFIGILVIISVTIFNLTCETEPRPWTLSKY